jgi:hypothetical protein
VRFRRSISTAVLGAAAVVSVAACGDQPKANEDLRAVATHSSYTAPEMVFLNSPPALVTHAVLTGHLVDGADRTLPGTYFHEDCATIVPFPKGSPPGPTFCTATVLTGTKTYVARGSGSIWPDGVHGPYFGQLGSLGPGGGIGPGSAVMWILPAGTGTAPIHVKISLRLWGSGPVSFR